MSDRAEQAEPRVGVPTVSGRRVVVALGVMAVVALALFMDVLVYRSVSSHDRDAFRAVEVKDWYRLLRVAGYWPAWAVVGAAVLLHDIARRALQPARRATFLVLSAALGGVAAEALKVLVGRMRPEDTGGAPMRFVAWGERLARSSDLSMPSSHVAVAFAGAAAAAWLWRGCGPVVVLLACGCALTRVLAGAHFASDVVVGALVGWGAAAAIRRLDARNNGGQDISLAS